MSLGLGKWDFELVDILLQKGAVQLPQISFDINETNASGESRLTAALKSGLYNVSEFLLQHGASRPKGLVIQSFNVDPNMERLAWMHNHGFDIDERNEVRERRLSISILALFFVC